MRKIRFVHSLQIGVMLAALLLLCCVQAFAQQTLMRAPPPPPGARATIPPRVLSAPTRPTGSP
ncbi:MAG: hypothetical protein KBS77_07765, partial [Bacteroidales bacterium]|nr:hypothetical protein [Candidatus Colicola faecequi]